MQIIEMSACQVGRLIKNKEISVLEAAESALTRIRQTDDRLHAFIQVDESYVKKQASTIQKKLDQGRLAVSPLAGVPMAIKDNISTRDLATTCASHMLDQYQPPYNATVIEQLFNNDALLTGKTNMDEFAMGSTTETAYTGPTLNPWDLARSPGGSSGGSAAAVAARQIWYALGSDTGGSIRQPAAYCGLTGLKPTYGMVSRFGLIAYASSLDQIGPIARNAEDCAAVMAIIAAADHKDSTSAANHHRPDSNSWLINEKDTFNLKNVRIVLPELVLQNLDKTTQKALLATAESFKQLGATVAPVSLPLQEAVVPAYYLIACAEASANLARYDGIQYGMQVPAEEDQDLASFYKKTRSAGFGTEVKRRLMLGTYALSAGYYEDWYLQALKTRQLLIAAYDQLLGPDDYLLLPVTTDIAPLLHEKEDDPLARYLGDVYTVSANLTGRPALAFPCGYKNRLPLGAQLMGSSFADQKLLRLVHAFQQVTDYHRAGPENMEVKA